MNEFPNRDEESGTPADRETEAANEAASPPAEPLVPEDDEQAAAEVPEEVVVLQKEMSLLEEQLRDMRDRYVRAMADLDNAHKLARRQVSEARLQAVSAVVLDLLAIIDNFERALEAIAPQAGTTKEAQAVYDGIVLIYRQLLNMLKRRSIRPIEAVVGKPFDPALHEAVVQVPAETGQAEGTVAVEIQKGYLYGDQVLRPSKVGVVVLQTDEVE